MHFAIWTLTLYEQKKKKNQPVPTKKKEAFTNIEPHAVLYQQLQHCFLQGNPKIACSILRTPHTGVIWSTVTIPNICYFFCPFFSYFLYTKPHLVDFSCYPVIWQKDVRIQLLTGFQYVWDRGSTAVPSFFWDCCRSSSNNKNAQSAVSLFSSL